MNICRSFMLVCVLLAASVSHAQISVSKATQNCRDTAAEHLATVPRAYISAQHGSTTGEGNFLITWRSQPPNGHRQSGFCIVAASGRVLNFQFDAPPATASNSRRDGHISGDDALRICKNEAIYRLPGIPRNFIDTAHAADPGDGSYNIKWLAKPIQASPSSGMCNITWNGALKNFQFDRGSQPPPSVTSDDPTLGGRDPIEAVRACKATVSRQFPNVLMSFIEVDRPSVNGNGLFALWRARPPNGIGYGGSCDIAHNGHVTLTVNPH